MDLASMFLCYQTHVAGKFFSHIIRLHRLSSANFSLQAHAFEPILPGWLNPEGANFLAT